MHIDAGELLVLLERDLISAGWDGAYHPYPGITSHQFAFQHLRRSLVKKYLPGTSPKNPSGDQKAIDLFLKINRSCESYSLVQQQITSWEEVAINEAKNFIEDFFYPDGVESILSLSNIYRGIGIGPGSSILAPETDFYSKLAISGLSTTDLGLYILYRDAIASDPLWNGMEQLRSSTMGTAVVTGSRLSCVPKNTEISRTICTEPLLNMIFQKGIASAIEEGLRRKLGIHLSTQPDKNAELARIGSLTGRFGTIDLSSASDSMSITLCKEMLPRSVFDMLMRVRSPSTTLPGGEVVELHMIASMGNAFCFPLQTLLFSAVVVGCYRALGVPLEKPYWPPYRVLGANDTRTLGNFAVFGDDIIVETRCYNLVTRVLSILGFSVNHDKSFSEGPFRESCGSDFHQGNNVRGVYIQHLRDVGDCYSAINRLVHYGARHAVRFHNLVDFLLSRCRFLPVPYDEGDDAGVKVPLCLLNSPTRCKRTGAVKYGYRQLVPRKLDYRDERPKDVDRRWFHNPDGLLLAFLAGNIRTGFVVLRSFGRKAVHRKRYSSRWDYISTAQGETPGFAESWKASARAHLTMWALQQKREG